MLDTAVNALRYVEDCANAVLREYESKLSGVTGERLQTRNEQVQLRTNKKIKDGDFCLYVPSFRVYNKQQVASEFASSFTNQPGVKSYISSFTVSNQGHISIKLNRSMVFRDVITNVVTSGANYGHFAVGEMCNSILLTDMSISDYKHSCHGNQKGLTLDQFRTRLIAEHLKEVIAAVIQKKTTIHHNLKPVMEVRGKLDDLCERLGSCRHSASSSPLFTRCGPVHLMDMSSELLTPTIDTCTSAIRNCQYVTWRNYQESCRCNKEDLNNTSVSSTRPTCHLSCKSTCTIMAQQPNCEARSEAQLNSSCCQEIFEFEKFFAVHKDSLVGFDKNLIKSKVAVNNDLITSVSTMEMLAQDNMQQCGSKILIHVCSCKNQFTTQQRALVWQAISCNVLAQNQFFLCHGLVCCRETGSKLQTILSADDFLRLRKDQLTHSYLLKYGDVVKGPAWEDSITEITTATTKLEILSTSLRNTVKLDISDGSQDFREATFVMYNCARLHTLFQHFNDNVEKGIYPPLPSVDQVEFSLLKDQAEWELFLRYVMSYPSVVKEVYDSLEKLHGSLVIANTNKISVFLLTLSHEFSSYYGRVHILGEPKAHLFPIMFARLYLMKALQQVMHNCLKLLNIAPLTQM